MNFQQTRKKASAKKELSRWSQSLWLPTWDAQEPCISQGEAHEHSWWWEQYVGPPEVSTYLDLAWPPDAKNRLIWKDPDAGKDWRQEAKGMTEDEMVGWHYQFDGLEREQAPGVGDGQGNLACYSPWDCKESDTTEQLNWTDPQIHMLKPEAPVW